MGRAHEQTLQSHDYPTSTRDHRDITTADLSFANDLTAMAEAVPVGVYVTDAAGSCLYVNKRWCDLTGLSHEEASGDGWAQSVHPEDRDLTFKSWRKGRPEGREFAAEFRILRPDGSVRMVSSRAQPLFDKHGTVNGYLGAATDITEQYRSQESLRRLARTLSLRVRELNCLFGISHLVEAAGDSLEPILAGTVNLLPPSWQYPDITCSRIVFREQEYRTENFTESSWKQTADILVQGDWAGLVEVGYLEENEAADEGPFIAEEHALISTIAERLGLIAEHIENADRLRAQEAELRERLRFFSSLTTMGEMATSIAHELNQPLTAIATFADACSRKIDAGMMDVQKLQDILIRISNEALRAGTIIRGMRELLGKRQGHRVESDVNQLVRNIASLASVDTHLHNVQLHLDLSNSLPPVLVDEIQLQQVILNLIRNAVDAIEDTDGGDRKVIVRTAANALSEIEVSVADTGCGLHNLPEENLFEPFFTTKEHGTGLGLAISRSIVGMHAGRMWCRQNPDCGSTFVFAIPAMEACHDDPR